MTVVTFNVSVVCFVFFFFFSSRRRHTRCSRDWSSDVCSSDLSLEIPYPYDLVCLCGLEGDSSLGRTISVLLSLALFQCVPLAHSQAGPVERSEERRVGKECRSRWSPYH